MKCLMLEIVVAESAVAGMILCQNTHKSSQKDLINVFGKTLSIQCYSWRLGFLKGSLHLENSGKAIRPERHWTLALSNTRTHTHTCTGGRNLRIIALLENVGVTICVFGPVRRNVLQETGVGKLNMIWQSINVLKNLQPRESCFNVDQGMVSRSVRGQTKLFDYSFFLSEEGRLTITRFICCT